MNKEIIFPNGIKAPKIGQGTWKFGQGNHSEEDEIGALQAGIGNGLTLLDTAEQYGDGYSEQVLGKAIKDFNREELTLVSKVMPSNAGEEHMFDSIDQTLQNMGVNELDFYLLHWRGSIPLQETVDVFEEVVKQGKIKGWGVSNFDIDDMKELISLRDGDKVQTNQVMYHLGSRGIEYSLTGFMKDKGIPLMAYSPLAGPDPDIKEHMLNHSVIKDIAEKHGISPTQLLLAWLFEQENVVSIPKSGAADHTKQNAGVLNINLDATDLEALDQAFPAPDHKTPLEIR